MLYTLMKPIYQLQANLDYFIKDFSSYKLHTTACKEERLRWMYSYWSDVITVGFKLVHSL